MPQPKKAETQRQRRNKETAELILVSPKAPEPPEDLRPGVLKIWHEYWGSELAKLVDPNTDGPAIRRLFSLYDERDRAYELFKECRFVKGAAGQPRINPLAGFIKDLDTEIRQMEDRLGIQFPRASGQE